MKYWRVIGDEENYQFGLSYRNDYRPHDLLGTSGKLIDEEKLEFLIDDERKLPVGEFIPVYEGVLCGRHATIDKFRDLFAENDRLYKAHSNIGKLLVVAPMNTVHGFDFESSDYERFDQEDDIYRVFRMRLISDFYTEFHLFRLNDNIGLQIDVLVSDVFRERYLELELGGLKFECASNNNGIRGLN